MFLVLGGLVLQPYEALSWMGGGKGPIRWLWSSPPFRLRSLHDPEPAGFSWLAWFL